VKRMGEGRRSRLPLAMRNSYPKTVPPKTGLRLSTLGQRDQPNAKRPL
jgi:hypothetical protein